MTGTSDVTFVAAASEGGGAALDQVIGLSIHSGAHMTLFPAVVQELKRRKATDIVVFGGGIIPEDDIAALKKKGVAELFTPGTPLQEIVDWLRKRFPEDAR